jgi:signal transduction histidine kinase
VLSHHELRDDEGHEAVVSAEPARTPPDPVWQSLRSGPLRLLGSARPWRSLGYLSSGVPLGLVSLVVIVPLGALGVVLLPVVVGLLPLSLLFLFSGWVAEMERVRLRWVETDPVLSPHRIVPVAGPFGAVRARLRDPAGWRELAYAVLAALGWVFELAVVFAAAVLPVAMLLAPLIVSILPDEAVPAGRALVDSGLIWFTIPLGLLTLLLAGYLVCFAAAVRVRLTRALLVPSGSRRSVELVEVSRSRARLADQFEAERRQIERDLHDGAQQRLTSLAMLLGLAKVQLGRNGAAVETGSPAGLVGRAHEEAKLALAELGELIRGIHPKILTDRGLDAALGEIGDRCGVPVRVDSAVARRLSASAETAAYYAVSEALTNVVKHSGATHAEVTARYADGTLTVEITDDGRGGADPAGGSGLTGLADRAAAAGGTLAFASPSGGPTMLSVRIPCAPVGPRTAGTETAR